MLGDVALQQVQEGGECRVMGYRRARCSLHDDFATWPHHVTDLVAALKLQRAPDDVGHGGLESVGQRRFRLDNGLLGRVDTRAAWWNSSTQCRAW